MGRRMKTVWFGILLGPFFALCNISVVEDYIEASRVNLLIDLIAFNLKNNDWNNIITYGFLPDTYYDQLKNFPYTFVVSNTDEDDFFFEEANPYYSNTIIINCTNFTNYEESLRQVMSLPYWHPHANVILLYESKESQQNIATIFFVLWYYTTSNAILIQHDDAEKVMSITRYNPYVVNHEDDNFGCWTKRNLGMPINTFEEGFTCEQKCDNVSFTSKHRALRLGTCLGLETLRIPYHKRNLVTNVNFFEDRGKNLHGFAFRAYTTDVPPFTLVTEHENGSFTLGGRDGMVWNNLAELMNFTIDISPSIRELRKFNFETNIQQIFSVAHRKADLFLIPIYQFDVVVVEIDYSFAFKDSGVCFTSHRAPFETVLIDLKILRDNYYLIIEFFVCAFCIWIVYTLYSALEANQITLDNLGKNWMNTIRSCLSLTLCNPPRRGTFRIFLGIILWCFFILNFSSQATIISFFTAFKRGKEVDTYAEIVEKGYKIQGMASPDVLLPEENELFCKINSKLEPISDIFACVKAMENNSQRFCLMDCSVARYLERNMLNDKGEQYLHIARDRIHSYYLNFILPKYSVLTNYLNKYLMTFYEAGFVKKWEQYRYNDIKEEAPFNAISLEQFSGIFKLYLYLVLMTLVVFLLELIIGNRRKIEHWWSLKIITWTRTRKARKIIKIERKQNKITSVSSSTQT